jgi:hypothetical protein
MIWDLWTVGLLFVAAGTIVNVWLAVRSKFGLPYRKFRLGAAFLLSVGVVVWVVAIIT